MKLTWKRDPHSGHWAYGDTLGYQLQRVDRVDGGGWVLRVRQVVETVSVRHTLGQDELLFFRNRFDTLPEAKTVVQFFEDDPTHDMFKATMKYHDEVTRPRLDAILAEYDTKIGSTS